MARDQAGYTQVKMKFGLFERVNHLTSIFCSSCPTSGSGAMGKGDFARVIHLAAGSTCMADTCSDELHDPFICIYLNQDNIYCTACSVRGADRLPFYVSAFTCIRLIRTGEK